MTVTCQSIAGVLNLSVATVSMALRDHDAINIKTRRRVQATAKRLGYTRNAIAGAMVTGKTRILGFIANNLGTEHVGKMLQGVLTEAREQKYFVNVLNFDRKPELPDVAEYCASLKLDGVLMMVAHESWAREFESMMKQRKIPLVFTHNREVLDHAGAVGSDDQTGTKEVIDLLVQLGHTRIAFIGGGHGDVRPSQLREEGFRKAMAEHGLAVPDVFCQHEDVSTIHFKSLVAPLLNARPRPQAIVCFSDPTAVQVLRVAHQMGIRVPEELSITGFSDLTMGKHSWPSLTTVRQPYQEIGRLACERLITMTENKDAPVQPCKILPIELVIRESTGPAWMGD